MPDGSVSPKTIFLIFPTPSIASCRPLGVAKLSVVNFFKWLDEADEEGDDEGGK